MNGEITAPFSTATVGTSRPASVTPPTVVAGLALAAIAVYLDVVVSGRQALGFLIGAAAGLVLYHAAFGFTTAWRQFVTAGRGEGLRAQMVMLALTCLVFFPLLARGELWGSAVRGSVAPVGTSVVVGAFLFGIGMQLAGGCASGTLYRAGGGNTRMLITLAAFIAGSVIGTAHMAWWTARPSLPPISIVQRFGPWRALAASLLGFAVITAATVVVERKRPRHVTGPGGTRPTWIRGPWPLMAGAVGLAVVNIATLLTTGRPWGVTSAFALWGAKALLAFKVPVDAWAYWSTPAQRLALHAPLAADVTSVMDGGLMLGAMVAAGLAGRFAPTWHVSARGAAASVMGGLLLGYGARIAYGCNIGAYFSGIASGSLHGWVWLLAAFAGSAIGTRLRPLFFDAP